MNTYFEYRSYAIRGDGTTFGAESMDGERFKLRSASLPRLTRAIDTLWNAMEGKVAAPEWVYASDLVDLDAAAEAMLIVDRPRARPCFPLRPVRRASPRAAA
jgi:hypothetical protein